MFTILLEVAIEPSLMVNVPALIVVVPVKVLTPERLRLPTPSFVIMPTAAGDTASSSTCPMVMSLPDETLNFAPFAVR